MANEANYGEGTVVVDLCNDDDDGGDASKDSDAEDDFATCLVPGRKGAGFAVVNKNGMGPDSSSAGHDIAAGAGATLDEGSSSRSGDGRLKRFYDGTDADLYDACCTKEMTGNYFAKTAEVQMPKRGRGRPRKAPKTSRFGEIADSHFVATATEIYFEVAGKPSPKKRAAFGRNNNRYNPSKVDEQDFAEVATGLCRLKNEGSVPKFPSHALLVVQITFYFPCKKPLCASLCKEADIDNLCKFVLDALNEVLYTDDRQIVELTASKCFASAGSVGRTAVSIKRKP